MKATIVAKMTFSSTIYIGILALFLAGTSVLPVAKLQLQKDQMDINKPLNILYLVVPSMGHVNPMLALVDELVSRNHNVTVCVGVDDGDVLKLKDLIEQHHAEYFSFKTTIRENILKPDVGMIIAVHLLSEYINKMVHTLNQSLTSKAYDIILGDEIMGTTLLCISSRWKIPSVIVGSSMQMYLHHYPTWPWPGIVQGTASDNLSFLQRMISAMVNVFGPKVISYLLVFAQKDALQEFCPTLTLHEFSTAPGVYFPHIVPTVIGFEFPRTLSPLTVYVGPLISKNPIPLSKEIELKNWLDSKPDRSVVYFSMGSIFDAFNVEKGRIILEGIMLTNYSLLWSLKKSNQWILDHLQVDTDRVFISGWTPQFSVLASKAIHSAILHGGFNGLSEALWNGVPVIGFPQVNDQFLNVGRLYHNGLGLRLDADTITSSNVANAVTSIDDGEYHKRVYKLQKIYKFAGGVERAADLVEFYEDVGYAHLIPAYAKYQWSWIQYHNADVWLVIFIVVLLLLFLTIKLLKCLFKCCMNSKCCTKRKQKRH